MTLAATVGAMTGVPTKLLRKTTLIPASALHLPVHTLTFAIPSAPPAAHARICSHAAVRLDLGDVVKMVIPGYKPKSYSVSALRPADDEFDVTLKVYPGGRASGFIDRLRVGEEMGTFGMRAGRRRRPGRNVGIVVFGVGITEGLPVARAELDGEAEEVVLLWASRTMDDAFWLDEIGALEEEFPGRFRVVHILSREVRDGCLRGRIDQEVLGDIFGAWQGDDARFLPVGTKEMMAITDGLLGEIGFPMPQHALLPKRAK